VQAGICYHLVTSVLFQKTLAEYNTPEILRLSLEELILQVYHNYHYNDHNH
jgi:HrpA-like RNA helicase